MLKLRIALSLSVALSSACGGGGGGGGGATLTAGPVISGLSYTPTSTTASGSDIPVSGTFTFTSSADLKSLKITDSDNNSSETPIGNPAGARSGLIGVPSAAIAGNPARTYTFNLSVVDVNGRESNKLAGQIAVQRAQLLAVAGRHRTTYPNSTVNLSGTATNNNGTQTNYLWTIIGNSPGTAGVIASPTSQTTTFTTSAVGVFRLGFQISDGTSSSTVSPVRITSLPPGKFSLFSTTAQLTAAQGQPSSLFPPLNGVIEYQYGPYARVYLGSQCDCVIGWTDYEKSLNLVMLPATWITNGQSYLSLTSTLDDVVRIQGTPTSYSFSTYSGHTFTFGWGNEVRVSDGTGLVTRWTNGDGTLKLAP